MNRIVVNEKVCIGCRLCEIYCQAAHSKSGDIIKTFNKETPPLPRVSVKEKDSLSFAVQCRQCVRPDCVYSCLTGAMYIDKETGYVQYDEAKCIGCHTCILVCPHGAIRKDFSADGSKKISKCDFCKGREMPECVKNCPNGALKLES